jgi:hypothetical protein
MARRRASPPPKLVWLVLCLVVSVAAGCARPSAVHRTEPATNSPAAEQNLPFHQNPEHATDESPHPAVPQDRKSGSGTPFPAAAHAHSLPAGTLITVRLDKSLSIPQVRPGDTFAASVAGPLTLDGDILVERGTPVSGRVESAQPSVDRPGSSPDPGYVRLTLIAITIDGKALDLQTSSLFAKGTFQSGALSNASSRAGGSDARFRELEIQRGRRLTFRLNAPLTFADPNSVADRQYPHPSNE